MMEMFVYFASSIIILACAIYMALDPIYPDKIVRRFGLGVLVVAQFVILSDGLFGAHKYMVLPCTVATQLGGGNIHVVPSIRVSALENVAAKECRAMRNGCWPCAHTEGINEATVIPG